MSTVHGADLATFAAGVWGRRVTATGGIGGQCVDLANIWRAHNGMAAVHRNAVDWAAAVLPGMRWEANGPANYPPGGALVVWGPFAALGIGQYGHIAVCLVADAMNLVTLEQNWPDGAPCAADVHSYAGVLGWQILAG